MIDLAADTLAADAAATPNTGPNHQKTKTLKMPMTNAATAILLLLAAGGLAPRPGQFSSFDEAYHEFAQIQCIRWRAFVFFGRTFPMTSEPNIEDIRQAHARIKPFIHRTPVLTSRALNDMCAAEVFFKCENFQKAGAFKIRGAANAVVALSEEDAKKGVATHSSGNFAAALALAARSRGIAAYVVMPSNTPSVKKSAVAGYGAEIVYCEPTLEAREKGVAEVIAGTGATFVHPYNDYRIIAGQGTAALELIDEVEGLDAVLAPVGGGGLISGTAIATRALSAKTKIIAAEPKTADDAYRSLEAGRIIPSVNPKTISDGLKTSLGSLTFPIIKKYVSKIITVSEQETVDAMRHIWERMKIVVEPSAAVGFAAVLAGKSEFAGSRIGIILSGGNVDLTDLPWK